MNVWHHILAIHDDRSFARRAQRHVQNRALLRDVDLLAVEHRVDFRAQAALLRQLHKQSERLVRDAVLRIIQEKAQRFHGKPRSAIGVLREHFFQMHAPEFLVMSLQSFPRGTAGHCDVHGG